MPGAPRAFSEPRPIIQCGIAGCANPASVRLFTATGWINVCARVDPKDTQTVYHYETVKTVPYRISNPYLEEVRAAYLNSVSYQNIHGPQRSEPGSDNE